MTIEMKKGNRLRYSKTETGLISRQNLRDMNGRDLRIEITFGDIDTAKIINILGNEVVRELSATNKEKTLDGKTFKNQHQMIKIKVKETLINMGVDLPKEIRNTKKKRK